jgi:hypothetical protein
MDRMTAIRSFGNAGYTPARKVRVENKKWYLVTLQNIERDQGDYMGLGEGEYQVLVPGAKAREYRQAHLNHCNRIEEYNGEVFGVTWSMYNVGQEQVTYCANTEAVKKEVERINNLKKDHIEKCIKGGDDYLKRANAESIIAQAKRTSVGINCIDDPQWVTAQIAMYEDWAKQSYAAARKAEDSPDWITSIDLIRE